MKTTLTLLLLFALPASAQWIPCLPEGQALPKIPELISNGGKLRGTVLLIDEQQRMTFRNPPGRLPGDPGTSTRCAPQYVRAYRGLDTVPPYPGPADNGYLDPMPGPTLRARVGDLVQLTFLNQVNVANFGDSIDRGEQTTGTGCDETSVYPKSGAINDTYPNCFHGSSTANLHFHGTHTNPNTTGDNVFLEMRPSLRENGKPIVTPETVREPFDEFFRQCESALAVDPLRLWPRTWSDLPTAYTQMQETMLKRYDLTPGIRKLWPVNEAQLKMGAWPQYYIGAVPYCFRLPEYKQSVWPPAPAEDLHAAHTAGAGKAEVDASQDPVRPLVMGQAPGTHWYHAHKHGSTAINVANGMTGAFIIEGQYDDDLNAFYGENWTRTQPTIVINQLGVSPNLMVGGSGRTDKGPDFSVNGRLRPVVTMHPGEVQMWRIVNGSGRAGAFFNGPDAANFEWKQLAQDGVQLNKVNYDASVNPSPIIAAGNRVDLLVKVKPGTKPGSYPVLVQNLVDPSDLTQTNKVPLFTVNVTGTGSEMQFAPAPSFPPFLADIADSEVTGTKKIVFASTGPGKGGSHTIDGTKFSGEVGVVTLLNRVEEWKVSNATYGPLIAHPFHIHINPFQVVQVFAPNETITVDGKTVKRYVFDNSVPLLPGQCYLDPQADPETWAPCGEPVSSKDELWWDVFPIPSGTGATDAKGNKINKTGTTTQVLVPGYFKLRSRFVDYPGYYVIHCHILAHEDRGMMTVVQVAPVQSPYSHH